MLNAEAGGGRVFKDYYDILESCARLNRPSGFPLSPFIIFSMFLISLGGTGSEESGSDLTVSGLLEGGVPAIGGVTLCGGDTGGLAPAIGRVKDLKAEPRPCGETRGECERGLEPG